ncbi:hypothetical protein Mycch_4279 [Mycolicibacterium chubuense NBB4]|uniref:DUF4873 domain-containing protein n=1 Tax=Mycolicibacterium chubuense (strain NBB4) TaxID=710421 RepID=I4BNY6_MYCCN|nr:DUF4873 domain-containing protein [Mycolicibacterium chubuense]AFM18993.1 hypothetical protein Mycch_4279 [Mycolicibacterium chubuense NBB4]
MTDIETVAQIDAPVDAEFDEATHTWSIGDRRARVLIARDGALPATFRATERLEPYLGVAVHGLPNYFVITGPDVSAQKAYIAKCLAHLNRTDSTRIEVRATTQRLYHQRFRGRMHRSGRYWRRVGRRIGSAFDTQAVGPDENAAHDGPATVRIAGRRHRARVRLTGQVDPIDGHYHWQGTLFGIDTEVRLPQPVTIEIDDRSAEGRMIERTPQSTYTVVGTGTPPFALPETQIVVRPVSPHSPTSD